MSEKLSNPKDLCGINKAPMSCVPAAVLAEVGTAMLEGKCKYGAFNWRAVGVRYSVYYDATMRHLTAFNEGEDTDSDSGMSHITKAITSLVVLRDAMIQGKVTDDRPPKSVEFYTELNKKAAAIVEKYADKNPKHYTMHDALFEGSPEDCKLSKTKPSDGWIEWSGGDCPVEWGTKVDLEFLDGVTLRGFSEDYEWRHNRRYSAAKYHHWVAGS